MALEIVMPRLSDSMEEGTIVQWLVQAGDHVDEGQPLVEVETDKASVVYEAQAAGSVLELLASEGESVRVGALIALLGEPGASVDVRIRPAGPRGPHGPRHLPWLAGSLPSEASICRRSRARDRRGA